MKDGVFGVCRYFYIFPVLDVLSVIFMSVEADHADDCLVWGFVFCRVAVASAEADPTPTLHWRYGVWIF
jgi:hypothetical protein